MNKEDARRVLRHMLPCSGTTVAKYCQAIKPSAVRLAQEQQQDNDVANNKRGEFAMHGIQAHKSQQEFLQQALVPFNGTVPSPTELLRWRRSGGVGGVGAVPGGAGGGPQFGGDGRGGGAAAQPPQPASAGTPGMAGPPSAASGGLAREGSMQGMHAPRGPPAQAAGQMPPGVEDPAMQMGPPGMMGPPHGAGPAPPGAPGHAQYQHMDAIHAPQPQLQQQARLFSLY